MGQIARQPAEVIRCCNAPSMRRGGGWELCHKPAVRTCEACTSSSKGTAAGRVWEPWETGAPAFYAFCRTLTLSHPRSNPPHCTMFRSVQWLGSGTAACETSSVAQLAAMTVPDGMHWDTLCAGRLQPWICRALRAMPMPVEPVDRFVRLLYRPSHVCDEFFTFERRCLIDSARHWPIGLTIPRLRSSP